MIISLNRTFFFKFIGFVYFLAYLSLYPQWHGLVGPNGLLPVADRLSQIRKQAKVQDNFGIDLDLVVTTGNIAILSPDVGISADVACEVMLWLGMISSLIIVVCPRWSIPWFVSWICYVSLIHCGEVFLSFQWDILLSECGFLCFLSTFFALQDAPVSSWSFRFLLWKLMFMSGVVKLQSRCPTWENLTALEYHFASQCIPTPLAWFAHQFPPIFLRAAVAATILIEIPLTFMLISPLKIVRRIGTVLQVFLQLMILLTGNYNFFNILTIALTMQCWLSDDTYDLQITKEKNDLMSFLSSDGLFATIFRCFRQMSEASAGRIFQYFLSLAVIAASATSMISVASVEGPWWIGQRLILKMTWKDIQIHILPACIFAMVTCLALSVLSYASFAASSTHRTISSFLISCWRLVGVIALLFWITLSASSLRGICDIAHYIPSTVLKFQTHSSSFFLVSSYGLFRRMTGVGPDRTSSVYPFALSTVARPEIVLEGWNGNTSTWHEIPFLFKPGDVYRHPPFVAPHQPRLDWQMWFAALGSYQQNPWLVHLVYKLLTARQGHDVLQLLNTQEYPFRRSPPEAIRATLYDYQFTTWNTSWTRFDTEVKSLNGWWIRSNPREYLPSLQADNPSLKSFLKSSGIKIRKTKTPMQQFDECRKKNEAFMKQFARYASRSWIEFAHEQICTIIIMDNDRGSWSSLYLRIAATLLTIVLLSELLKSHSINFK